MKCLKTLKVAKNKIATLQEIGNLAILPNLENLTLAGNPVCEIEDCQSYVIYYISSLESLDGNIVNSQLRQKASKKYAGPSPETWVVRENLVSFRRMFGDKSQEKKELEEEFSKLEDKITKVKNDINNIDVTIEKNRVELENIEGALENSPSMEDNKKKYMRDLLDKTENLRDSSIGLQEKMRQDRTLLQKKKDQFEMISKQVNDTNKVGDREYILEEKCKLSLEIDELEDSVEELETQYGIILEELNRATEAINKVEEEILAKRDLEDISQRKKGKARSGQKKDTSFTMDSETQQFLTSRKEEIIKGIPELKLKKQQLTKELEGMLNTQSAMLQSVRDLEREILDITRQTNECEEFLHKISTPSPMRGRTNTKLMWDSVKSLWQLLTDNPWEYESDDIQKGIIRWAEHMKEHVTRYKTDNDSYLQLLAQQRIDQANISHLHNKIKELSEQLMIRSNLNDEIDTLNARIDGYKDKEKKWGYERNEYLEKIRNLEGKIEQTERINYDFAQSEALKVERASIEALQQEKKTLKENIKMLSETGENQEQELKNRINKLKGYCETKAQELHELNESLEEKIKEIQQTKETAEILNKKKDELTKAVEELTASKKELEYEVKNMNDAFTQIKPLKAIEEEKEKWISVLKKIAVALDIDPNIANSKSLLKNLEQKLEKLKEDLAKAEKFKFNKQKFLEMYESNTKELQDEWNTLKIQKEEIELEKSRIENVKLDKKSLDDQMRQLVSTSKELQRLKSNLEKEKSILEENISSLKQSISMYEGLKQKEINEYNRIQALHESEMQKLEESLSELKILKAQIKDLKNEKNDIEAFMSSAKNQLSKIEDKKRSLEEEIREGENSLYKLANKLTDEQIQVQKDIERVKRLIDEKEKDIENYETMTRNYEVQMNKVQEQAALAANKLERINNEIDEKEAIFKEKKNQLREIESKCLSSESSLDRTRKESELLNQSFIGKKHALANLDAEIENKTNDLSKITARQEQGANEAINIEKQIARIKSDLQGVEQIIFQKNKEYEIVSSNLRMKAEELKDIENEYNGKYMAISKSQQKLSDIHAQAKAEEEAILIFREESKSLQNKIAKLTETLKRVEGQKLAVLQEIEEINFRVEQEETTHRKELENLRNAVSNGESTLRQLMESVQRCRNKLASDKEETNKIADELNRLIIEKNDLENINRDLTAESIKIREDVSRLKTEEDAALVILALSGHKIDDKIKQRITSLCRAATELELLRSQMHSQNIEE